MIFDDRGKITRIEPVPRTDAHRMIEECMLAANVCAAEFLAQHAHPILYRVHEGPNARKLDALQRFLAARGLRLGGGASPTTADYADLVARVRERPDAGLIQTMLLRSMQQAVYRPEREGHFGLAYEAYTHFTSPIRRYPDLLVHRAIKAVLAGKRYRPVWFDALVPGTPRPKGAARWAAIGQHCSMTERRADEASREVSNWLKCDYMQDHVGACFDGTVSAVTAFGVFVMLDGVYVEGLLHVSALGEDYFRYDDASHRLVGERTGISYGLTDRLRVQVARVDLELARVELSLAASC
jgi:ribonuclease R